MTKRYSGLRTLSLIVFGAVVASGLTSTLASSADASSIARSGLAGHLVETLIFD